MAKAIINKHIDDLSQLKKDTFVSDLNNAKGEIVICNDPANPTIYIMDSDGTPRKIAGGSNGEVTNYDDTAIWAQVNANTEAIEDLKKNGLPAGGSGVLQEDIIVAGLDEKFGAGNYKNGDVISAGTSYQTIFTNFLCKENYPTNVTTVKATAKATLNDLSLTLTGDEKMEVGTLVSLTSAQTNGTTIKTTASTISNLTYGYSLSDNDTALSTDTTITKPCTAVISDNTYTISATITNGFDADSETYVKTTPETQTGDGNTALQETVLGCITEGQNEIIVAATGASYTYSADAIEEIYYVSNLGGTDAAKKNNGVAAVSDTTSKPETSISAEIEGAYKYFMGYSEKTSFDQFDSDSIRSLEVKSDWVTMDDTTEIVDNNTNIKSNGKSVVIACPAKYKLATINYSNKADMLPKFTSVGIVSVKTGEIYTDYNVYVYPITNNAEVEYTNVTLVTA